jgi:hypothetical protein
LIHINYPNGRKPPDDWLEKARVLTENLKVARDKAARDKIIDDNSPVWGEIKGWLEEFSDGKCWFSEARGRCFHWQVEHFRPKKEAKDPDRGGYWWRTFDHLNYRLCGSVTNSKKGSYFPLRPGTVPASCPEDDCDDESCLLIDPVRKSDVDLITFSNGGVAVPAKPDGWEWERADRSIKRYKLNEHIPLRRGREEVWTRCKQKVDELEELMEESRQADIRGKHSPSRKQKIERLCLDIEAMTSPSAEFSAVARAFLLQDTRPWVRRLVA